MNENLRTLPTPSAGRRPPVRTPAAVLALAAALAWPTASLADEGGVSFWVPGIYGSLAATPLGPGWTVNETYYRWTGWGGADVALAREITIGRFNPTLNVLASGSLKADADIVFGTAVYTFQQPVLGGQASVGMLAAYGRTDANLSATVTATLGPLGLVRSDMISQAVTGFGDLYPQATLRWNHGVDNFMWYVTGDIPVGLYSSSNLANIGIGHGAIDSGFAYTYLNPQTGWEFSVTTGLTYNFINPETQYQNGVDWHLDWGASKFLTKEVFVGAVGYVYDEIGCDSGSGDRVGCFRSRVLAVGPQVGIIFPMSTPVGPMQGYINLKGYAEFDNQNRAAGYDAWVSFTITPPVTPPAAEPIVRKY
jgi:hypothetical protein